VGLCRGQAASDNPAGLDLCGKRTNAVAVSKPSKKSLQAAVARWAAPMLAFLILAGSACFVIWLWLGGSGSSGAMDIQTAAALAASPYGSRQPIPPMRLPNGNGIASFGFQGSWIVRYGTSQMQISMATGAIDFQYRYVTRTSDAYSGEDLQLANLAVKLSNNPLAQRKSGAPQQLIQRLRKDYARDLSAPPLQLSNGEKRRLQDLWAHYVLAGDTSSQQAAGTKLIDTFGQLAKDAAKDNRSAWDATIAAVRDLIPPAEENQYDEAIRQATALRFSSSQPSP